MTTAPTPPIQTKQIQMVMGSGMGVMNPTGQWKIVKAMVNWDNDGTIDDVYYFFWQQY